MLLLFIIPSEMNNLPFALAAFSIIPLQQEEKHLA